MIMQCPTLLHLLCSDDAAHPGTLSRATRALGESHKQLLQLLLCFVCQWRHVVCHINALAYSYVSREFAVPAYAVGTVRLAAACVHLHPRSTRSSTQLLRVACYVQH
jgi:hypothetical protein